LKIYKEMNFTAAKESAIKNLSRFYNVSKIEVASDSSCEQEFWTVELEILRNGQVMILPITLRLDCDFPLSLPRLHISKKDVEKLGYIPNIDTGGLVCVYDANTNLPDPEQPEIIVEICVRKAKEIIEQGLRGDANKENYDKEFIAYWENNYGGEQAVDIRALSLINDEKNVANPIKYVCLQSSLGKFSSIIYSDPQSFETIQKNLNESGIKYFEIPTFYLGELNDLNPPFNLNNKDIVSIATSLNKYEEFVEYLNSAPLLPIVTFSKNIDGRFLFFGWIHKQTAIKSKRRRRILTKKEIPLSPKNYARIADAENGNFSVNRFSPQVLTWERLKRRSSADFSAFEKSKAKRVLIAGLGSIGSNLIPYLENMGIPEFVLVDDEVLTLDNIGRHLLGLSDVYKGKTHAVRDYLISRNPLISVSVLQEKVMPLIKRDSTVLESCDFHFFCTGDINSEMWLGNNMVGSSWGRPSFFVWVEPYLLGGHCVYYNGVTPIDWNGLFPGTRFLYNFISEDTHKRVEFTKRENGCQSTYIPYGSSMLHLFLASIFPKIHNHLQAYGENTCYSWIGDLSFAAQKNILISKWGTNLNSFDLVERKI